MQNILVTGGAGYIGSHACKTLNEAGKNAITFDNLCRGFLDSVQFGPFVEGDLLSVKDLEKAFEKYEIDSVMHFAAYAYVGESVVRPHEYWKTNVVGTMNLLNTMKKYGVKKIVFSSTCSVYGENDSGLITENSKIDPLNPYARTKYTVEQMIRDFCLASDLSAFILRYFNVAGADVDGLLGERHDPETHLIPLVIKAAYSGDTIKVFGSDYPTKDGTCVRDYIHVTDLVNAHIQALDFLSSKSNCLETVNLGTGTGYSVFEIIEEVEKCTGKKINVEVVEKRFGDGAILVSDNAKARSILNWKLNYSDLSTQINSAVEWYKKNGFLQDDSNKLI